LFDQLLADLAFFPVVGLIGARQVGKTTLAKMLADHADRPIRYFDLERTEDFGPLSEDPEFFLEQFKGDLVVIDEVQRLPSLFAELRSLIDRDRRPGRFLLLGSASPLLLRQTADSLAGRIAYLTLHPLHLTELQPQEDLLRQHWSRGGFPSSWLAHSESSSFRWRKNFIQTYVERDLPMLGLDADPVRFRNFLHMLAASNGNLWNAESLGRSLGLTGKTIKHYLGYLESSFFVHILQPYSTNVGKRLVKTPKVYLTDSGLLHSLLGVPDSSALTRHPQAGSSWEGYVVQQIVQQLPEDITAYFYRTSDGTECDLVLVQGLQPVSCIEIKLGNTVQLSRGFVNTIQTLETSKNFIITFNARSFEMKNNIRVVGAEAFIRKIATLFS
jgi:predicted AAA+ superfamily ATPase